jgi:hypothetical protein
MVMTKLVKTTGATTFADSNFCLREACACNSSSSSNNNKSPVSV